MSHLTLITDDQPDDAVDTRTPLVDPALAAEVTKTLRLTRLYTATEVAQRLSELEYQTLSGGDRSAAVKSLGDIIEWEQYISRVIWHRGLIAANA